MLFNYYYTLLKDSQKIEREIIFEIELKNSNLKS